MRCGERSGGLAWLVELEQVNQTKYRYMRCVDTKDWAGLAECLIEDAEARYGEGADAAVGPDGIVAFVSQGLPAGVSSAHTLSQPEIRFTSETTAEGTWMLGDVVVDPGRELVFRGAARHSDEYRKQKGAWRIHRTGFVRLYEEAFSARDSSRFDRPPAAWLHRAGTGLHVPQQS